MNAVLTDFFSRYLKLSLVIFFAVTSCRVNGAELTPLNRYFSQVWDTHDGLPHNSINALAQTPDGYIWAGTWEGVARYNGVEFEIFTRGEATGLPDSGIRSLTFSPTTQEMLVAGSRGGVISVVNQHWAAHPDATDMVNHAYRSKDGRLWLALEDAGVKVRSRNGSEIQYIAHSSAYRIIEDKAGRIWWATNQGLYRFIDGAPELAATETPALAGPSFSLALNHNGDVLVGTEQGLWQHSDNGFTLLHPGLASESISSILVDHQHSVWVGTINHGVFRLSKLGLEKLDATVGLPNNRILSLLEDEEHSIWIGTNGGIFRLRKAPFTTFTQSQGLSGDYLRAILQTTDGNLLVGSSGGLDSYRDGQFTALKSPFGRPVSVLSLTQLSIQSVLVGSYTDGVLLLQNNSLTPYLNRDNGLPSNEIRAILKASDGSVWYGTAQGVVRQNRDGSMDYFDESHGLAARFTMGLAEDKFGRIWVATGMGVAYFENGKFHKIAFADEFNAQYAFSFQAGDEGVWMATDRGVAFFEFETGQVLFVGKEQGLPIDKIFALSFDKQEQVWISSNQGIVLTSLNSLKASMSDARQKLVFTHFKEGDGLASIQINGGSQPSQVVTQSGELWFATAKGLATTHPGNLTRISEYKIPVSIEQVQLDGRVSPLSYDDEPLRVNADVDRVSIKYAGLGFAMPTRIEYQVMLQGYDDTWDERGRLRITEYTNLAPGKYQFHVRARYPGGAWQQQTQPLHLVVEPKLWQTLGFKLLMCMVLVLLIAVGYRLRFYHLKKSAAHLQQRVDEQTRTLERQAKAFEYQATHDQLTGIANRRAFDKWLIHCFEQAKREGKPLSLAIIDIDHFKQVNDKFSHIVGDKVIAEVASQIKKVAPENAIFARWGGEEFTLLLPHTELEQALECMQHIRYAIKAHDFDKFAKGLSVTVSAGVADIGSANDYDRLLSQADKALYMAKQQGRDRVVAY